MESETKKRLRDILVVASLVGIIVWALAWNAGVQHVLNFGERIEINKTQDEKGINISGQIHVWVKRGINGQWILSWSEGNTITNLWRDEARKWLGQYSTSNPGYNSCNYIAIGTGSGGGAGSTSLQTEAFKAEGAYVEPSQYNYTITVTFPAGTFAGETITEAGLFNETAASSGLLMNYQDFSGITLQSGDSLQVQFEIQVGS